MKFICIMGHSNSGKTAVEKALEKLGFKRSISYTTREPQIKNNIQEKNGVDYRFVTEKKFMMLVDTGKIVEYTKYDGNFYGTPRPYGSKNFVGIAEINGYKKLKDIFGKQVVGVYLKCDRNIILESEHTRDSSDKLIKQRDEQDESVLNEMEELADFVVNANQPTDNIVADILNNIRTEEI